MKKNIAALSLIILLVLSGLFYLMAALLSNYKAADLENLTIEKVKAAVRSNISSVNRSLENSDDISLLINIETIARIENINSCFILDRDNKVIIHNNTNEWNTERKSETYDRAVNYDGQLVQTTPDKDHLLFSAPLVKDYTLCCIFSVESASRTARFWKIRYFTVAAASALLITLILYFLAKLLILLPFNRTKKMLENSAENIKNEKYDEITDIFAAEKDKAARTIRSLEEDKESLGGIISSYFGASADRYSVFIILNSNNNIVYAYDKTGKFLKKDFTPGSHILESSVNPGIIQIITKASEQPGKTLTESAFGFTVTALSAGTAEKISGTVIKAL